MIVAEPAPKPGRRNSRGSSIGRRRRSSHRTKDSSTTAATTKAPTVTGSSQPRSGPSITPNTSGTSPTMARPAPTRSRGWPSGSFDVGTMRQRQDAAAGRRAGTLMKKTEPHQKCSSRRPEVIGPSAPPTPANAAHTAIAFGRSWNGKLFMMIDRVAGMMNAAPTPITARAAISCVGSSAKLATSAAPPNTTRPNCSAPLRPKRSPRAPAGSSMPAKTRA